MEPRTALDAGSYRDMSAPLAVGDPVVRTEKFGFSYPGAIAPAGCDLTFAVQRHEIFRLSWAELCRRQHPAALTALIETLRI